MKPLQECYKLFELLCICPPDKPLSRWKKHLNDFMSIIGLVSQIISLIASFVFVKKFFSIDLSSAICACFQIAGDITALCSLFIAYIKCYEFQNNFYAFQAFYDASK